jgi:uncharacterized repeat protein (TIGR03803 family)
MDVNGILYGTTLTGGSANDGVLFQLEPYAAAPVISGSVSGSSSITINLTDTAPGATIRYTTNGSTPTSSSTVYTGAFVITDNETIKAIAYAPNCLPSTVAAINYVIPAAAPGFAPPPGSYPGPLKVDIQGSNYDPTIRYTTNGSTPTSTSAIYTGPITLTKTTTIKAIIFAPDYGVSGVSSATYTIIPDGEVKGSQTTAAASYDLSTLGTTDWAHWGKATNHKAGATQISALTDHSINIKGITGYFSTGADPSHTVNWTNGSPTNVDTNTGEYVDASGELSGFSFVVPALTTTQTLYLLAGGIGGAVHIEAHLSDSSAPDYDVYAKSVGTGVFADLFKITFKAGTPGATLTITYENTLSTGRADLIAAALA